MNLHTDSLWIGKLIKARIDGVVPVYPCVVPSGTPDTFGVYRRTGFQGRDTKDGYNYLESLTIDIAVAAPSYSRALEIAQSVKDRLDGIRGIWDGKMINRLKLQNAMEDFSEGSYIQTLTFLISIDTSFAN